jgi:tRNA pseudouridine38-40 synthase
MRRILLQISYDGTNFSGWQIQPEQRTVQQTIENSLSNIFKEKIQITGSGRTDAGVHARNQFAHFDLLSTIPLLGIKKALNSNLPKDVRIVNAFNVKIDFHSRYNARSRIYEYMITKEFSPFCRFYKSFIPKIKPKPEIIIKCLPYFMGNHDFTAFAKHNPDLNNNLCEITDFTLNETEVDLVFEIQANRFLHNMVRRVIGTILNISHFNLDPEIIPELITQKNASHKLIYTAPPQGLYLKDVKYNSNIFR